MSAASDAFEKKVADGINKLKGYKAERPSVGTEFSDVKITKNPIDTKNYWLEVKMNHTDNLSNPRVFYHSGKWQTTYKTPAAAATVNVLNKSSQARAFILAIAKFANISVSKVKIPTTKSGLKEEGAVPLEVMKAYFNRPGVNRYIANQENYDLGKLVTEHYTIGKAEPAYYMQAADDFYLISSKNPLKLDKGIPVLKGKGDFKVRVSTRSEFYEVQAEIKISSMPDSKYSVLLGTNKINPLS
jgi:hypothetical protein